MMYAILPSKKRENVKKIESKLFILVDRKEKKDQVIDDHGRDIVIALRDYLQNGKSSVKYSGIMKEAKRYIKKNQHYY